MELLPKEVHLVSHSQLPIVLFLQVSLRSLGTFLFPGKLPIGVGIKLLVRACLGGNVDEIFMGIVSEMSSLCLLSSPFKIIY